MSEYSKRFRWSMLRRLRSSNTMLEEAEERIIHEIAYGDESVYSKEHDLATQQDIHEEIAANREWIRELEYYDLEDQLEERYSDLIDLYDEKYELEEKNKKLEQQVDTYSKIIEGLEQEIIRMNTENLLSPAKKLEAEDFMERAFYRWEENMLTVTEFIVDSESQVFLSIDDRDWPLVADIQFQEAVRVRSARLDCIGVVVDASSNEIYTSHGTISTLETCYYRVIYLDETGSVQDKWIFRDELQPVGDHQLTEDELWCIDELSSLITAAVKKLEWEQENSEPLQIPEDVSAVAQDQQTM